MWDMNRFIFSFKILIVYPAIMNNNNFIFIASTGVVTINCNFTLVIADLISMGLL